MIPYLSRGNKKYKLAGLRTRTFGLPAYESREGFRTCPGAGLCRRGCYAQQGRYVCPSVKKAEERRLRLARRPDLFRTIIGEELRQGRLDLVRIHDSGDFFSLGYLESWLELIAAFRATRFLAYTKMVPLFRQVFVPPNFAVIFSRGGKFDDQILDTDKQAKVFPDQSSLDRAVREEGYVDCHVTDLPALEPQNLRIGLVYHGFPSRRFST